MKQPYEIHSDFFKKMIASGWYENREIWYLTISYDAYYRSNGRIFLSTVLHNFGETTNTLLDYSIDDKDYIFYQKSIGKKLRNFGFADNREILIDELGRING